MSNRFLISKWQFIAAIIYSTAFPLSNLIGGEIQTFILFATSPFLFIGYIVGGFSASIFGSSMAYSFGLAVATFLQIWLLLAFWNHRVISDTQ